MKRTCLVCHSTHNHVLFIAKDRMYELPGVFRVIACDQCGLHWIDPMPKGKALSRYYPSSSYYAYQQGGDKSFFYRLRTYLIKVRYTNSLIGKAIGSFLYVPAIPSMNKSGKILDVGCGTGDTLLILKKLGWDVHGIEMDKKAVAIAQKRGLGNVTLGTYRDMKSYKAESFDVVRLYHVIEHLDDPNACLRFIRRILKPEGELIVGTPNVESLLSRITRQYWYNLDTPRHLFVFSPRTLEYLMLKHKFAIQEKKFCSGGGIVGTFQYIFRDKWNIRLPLLSYSWLVILFYPIERMLDLLHLGDIFVLSVKKTGETE